MRLSRLAPALLGLGAVSLFALTTSSKRSGGAAPPPPPGGGTPEGSVVPPGSTPPAPPPGGSTGPSDGLANALKPPINPFVVTPSGMANAVKPSINPFVSAARVTPGMAAYKPKPPPAPVAHPDPLVPPGYVPPLPPATGVVHELGPADLAPRTAHVGDELRIINFDLIPGPNVGSSTPNAFVRLEPYWPPRFLLTKPSVVSVEFPGISGLGRINVFA